MSIASTFGAPMSFYGLNGPGELVRCPDCGGWADALFGDHGGQCLDAVPVVRPTSALGIIRRYAERNLHFSAEQVRAELDAAGIPNPARGPAFGAASREGGRHQCIRADGFARSTGPTAKRAHLQTYTSTVFKPAASRPGRRTA